MLSGGKGIFSRVIGVVIKRGFFKLNVSNYSCQYM